MSRYLKRILAMLSLCAAGCGMDHDVNGTVDVSGKVDTSGNQTITIDIELYRTFLRQECLVLFNSPKKQADCVDTVLVDLDAFVAAAQ